MTTFGFEPIYGSWTVALLLAAGIVAAIALVTPPTANPVQRRWLIVLRSLAAATLLLLAAGPSLIRTDTEPTEATLVVAADTSLSMTLPDGEGSDRWSTQLEVWKQLSAAFSEMDERLELALLGYDAEAVAVGDTGADALSATKPEGNATDLGSAALGAIRLAEGAPLAGVVLIGDGTNTAGPDATDPRRVVETLDSIGVPLWTVPIGPASDGAGSRDVAIDSLPETFDLFAGNEFEVAVDVRLRGLAGNEVPVTLSWIDETGEETEAATRRVVANRALDTKSLSVALEAPEPGTYRLVAEARRQDGELIESNNQQTAFVEVREGGGRVLYLEGEVRLEQFFMRRALLGFPDLDLTYQWLPRDTASNWPLSLNDLLEPGQFDVYIIGDLDASAIGDEQLGQIAEAVAEGAGLIMMGGFQTFGAGGYADSPLDGAIPVTMDSQRRRALDDGSRDERDDQIPGPLTVVRSRPHPITDVSGVDAAEFWRQLPPLDGANRLLGPKAAPGIQVLLESSDGAPLLVVGEYGRGRTAALAIDSSYLWRNASPDFHRRFWRQLVLWMLSREESDSGVIRVEIDDRRFDRSSPPAFRASVQSLDEPVSAELVAEVIGSDQQRTSVPVTSRSGDEETGVSVEGKIPELEPGFYRLRVRDDRAGSELKPTELAFQVIDESRELEQPAADPVYLAQLSALTADHGGRAFTPDQIDELIETIAGRRQQAEATVVARHRLGGGPISGWLTLTVFVGLMSVEWWLRRKWGLA